MKRRYALLWLFIATSYLGSYLMMSLGGIRDSTFPQILARDTFCAVTAEAIIDQIKALSPGEQEKLIDFLDEFKKERQFHTIDSELFDSLAERVFTRHQPLLQKLSQ